MGIYSSLLPMSSSCRITTCMSNVVGYRSSNTLANSKGLFGQTSGFDLSYNVSIPWHLSQRSLGFWASLCNVGGVASAVGGAIKQVGDWFWGEVDTTRAPKSSEAASNSCTSEKSTSDSSDPKDDPYPMPPLSGFSTKNINIGIIGNSGTGKSSFINEFLHLEKHEKALTGIVETTGVHSGIIMNILFHHVKQTIKKFVFGIYQVSMLVVKQQFYHLFFFAIFRLQTF